MHGTNGNLNGYISTSTIGVGTVLVLAIGAYLLMSKKKRSKR